MSPLGPTYFSNTTKKNYSFDMDSMLQKAQERAIEVGDNELFEYIKNVLNNDKFQYNPKTYLKDWKKERGDTKEIRRPEDTAYMFFKDNFL